MAALGSMEARQLLRLCDAATARMTELKSLTINLVRRSRRRAPVLVIPNAHACTLKWCGVQSEEFDEKGSDANIFFRTCTCELTIPDWRVTPEEMKERLISAMQMSEIVGMQVV
jgi:hypothetical protein